MRTEFTGFPGRMVRSFQFLAASGAVILFTLSGAGCSEETATATAPGNTGGTGLTQEAAAPTLAELQSALGLSGVQVEQITPPLETWQRNQESGWDDVGSFGSPQLDYLAETAGILTQEQFLKQANLLTERQARHFENLGNGNGPFAGGEERGFRGRSGRRGGGHGRGHGPGMGHGRGSGIGADLGLTDEQHTALRELMQSNREARRALMDQFAEETISADDLKAALGQLQTDLDAGLQAILDADQYAAFTEHRAARETERAERRLEKAAQGTERKVEFLTSVLELDETQVGQVTEILNAAQAELTALLNQVLAGDIDPVDAFVDGLVIKKETRAAIEAILTEDQIARWEAIKDLVPGRGRRGHRP